MRTTVTCARRRSVQGELVQPWSFGHGELRHLLDTKTCHSHAHTHEALRSSGGDWKLVVRKLTVSFQKLSGCIRSP